MKSTKRITVLAISPDLKEIALCLRPEAPGDDGMRLCLPSAELPVAETLARAAVRLLREGMKLDVEPEDLIPVGNRSFAVIKDLRQVDSTQGLVVISSIADSMNQCCLGGRARDFDSEFVAAMRQARLVLRDHGHFVPLPLDTLADVPFRHLSRDVQRKLLVSRGNRFSKP